MFRSDVQKSTRAEKEMSPPSQSLNGQITGEGEDEESGDFDQLAKQEILKCRINSLKKQQVCRVCRPTDF